MKNFLTIGLILIIGLLMGGCAGLNISSDFDTKTDFRKYTTYQICPEDLVVKNSQYPEYDNQFNRNLIKEAVESGMNMKGYKRDESNPELQAGFKFVISDEVVSLINCYDESEFGYGSIYKLDNYYYKEETLMVYVSDLKTNQVIWHAIISKNLTSSPEKLKRTIQEKIAKLFTKYPI
ncbi:DUF4136 domain-containing protein [Flavobacteriaceae bacterium R38]|nr:DUF4136 domain-containing protein [Flavobacteriaceae bacterium R38]